LPIIFTAVIVLNKDGSNGKNRQQNSIARRSVRGIIHCIFRNYGKIEDLESNDPEQTQKKRRSTDGPPLFA